MKNLRLLFVMTFALGISLISSGQTGINNENNKEDSIQVNYNRVNFLSLEISMNVITKWEVTSEKKSATLMLSDSKSKIEISTMDLQKTLDIIFIDDSKENANNMISLLDSFKIEPNLTVTDLNFSKADTKIKNGYKVCTLYKIINKQAFLIEAKIDHDCVDCKKDFDFMIESMQSLK